MNNAALVAALAVASVAAVTEWLAWRRAARTVEAILSPDSIPDDAVDVHASTYEDWLPGSSAPADVVPGADLSGVEEVDWLVTVAALRDEQDWPNP